MAINLTGTWYNLITRDGDLRITDNNGKLSFAPVASDAWWSSGDGSWNQGEGNGENEQAPFFGTVTFRNNANQTYTYNFCVADNGERLWYSNGVPTGKRQ